MKILHVADLHGDLRHYRWVARAAARYDLVCIAGDLLDQGDGRCIDRQVKDVTTLLRWITTPLAVCSGNHDSPPDKWIRSLKGGRVWVDGDRFNLQGHSFYVHPWLEPIPAARPNDIWIIHTPPAGTATARGANGDDMGDFEFAQLCLSGRGPAIALCGHVHKPRNWNAILGRTHVLNPGMEASEHTHTHLSLDLSMLIAKRSFSKGRYETTALPATALAPALNERSQAQLEALIQCAVRNQQIEGLHLTSAEIEAARRHLRKLAFGS